MVRFRTHLLILLAALAIPTDLAGQHARVRHVFPEWHASVPIIGPTLAIEARPSSPFREPSAETNDYRWEGLIIGGVAVGTLGVAFGAGFCGYGNASEDSGCLGAAVGGGLMGALVGGVTGGLIGSQISK